MAKKLLAVIFVVALMCIFSVTAFADSEIPYQYEYWDGNTLYSYGELVTNEVFVSDNGYAYLLDENGTWNKTNGWHRCWNESYEEYVYYYVKGSFVVLDWQKIDGVWYYFNPYNGIMANDIFHTEDDRAWLALNNGQVITTPGWYQLESDWFYINKEDGSLATGWKQIGGVWYIFNEYWGYMYYDGVAFVPNTNTLDGYDRYLALKSGKIVLSSGWYKYNNEWYYMLEGGKLIDSDLQTINSTSYYFYYYDGYMATDTTIVINDVAYLVGSNGVVFNKPFKWYADNGNWYYVKGDGNLASDELLKIGDATFYFDSESNMVTGSYWINDELLLFNEKGYLVTEPGWLSYENDWYYVLADGTLAFEEVRTIGNEKFAFTYHGKMITNNYDYLYDFDNDDYGYFYADKNGYVVTENGWVQKGICWYYVEDGKLVTGWKQIGSAWYYFYPEMNVGAMYDYENETYYSCDDSGRSSTAISKAGWTLADGIWYYFPSEGEYFTGWYGNYYIRSNVMLTNTTFSVYNPVTDEYDHFYVGKDGKYQTGWINHNNTWYYADAYGYLQSGWQKIGNAWYYFEDNYNDFNMFSGVCEVYEDGEYKYVEFADTGAYIGYLPKEKWYQSRNGEWYYIPAEGFYYGWEKVNGTYYFFSQSLLQTNYSVYDYESNNFVWVDANGRKDTGSSWRQSNYGDWYYLDNGIIFRDGYRTINGATYYFDQYDGMMYKGLWSVLNETTNEYEYIFFNEYGVKQGKITTGWYYEKWENNLTWYYYKNGKPLEGWHTIGGITYLFDYGRMVTGLQWVDNNVESYNLYMFDQNGLLVRNQWYKYEGDWYYVNDYGRVLTGEHTIGGVKYYFNNWGVLV